MKRIILGLAMSVICFSPAVRAERQMDGDSAANPGPSASSQQSSTKGQSANSGQSEASEQSAISDQSTNSGQSANLEQPSNPGQSANSGQPAGGGQLATGEPSVKLPATATVGSAKTTTKPINSALAKFYLEYHDKMLSAKSVDDMLPYLAAKRCADIKGDEKKMPRKDIDFMFSLMKDCCPPKVRVLDEKVDEAAGRAELTLDCPGSQSKIDKAISMLGTSNKEETHGLVRLVKEDGAWKVDKEEWKTSSVIKD